MWCLYLVGTINWVSLHDVYHSADVQQRVKKVVYDSPGLVDFAVRLVNYVHNFPNGQVKFLEKL